MPQKQPRRRPERRKDPRAEARLSMRVEGLQEGKSTQIVAESQNISASGVYCTSSRFLAPLSKVALTLVLPKLPGVPGVKKLIKCEGIVVRCEPVARKSERCYELACMFSNLDLHQRALLEEFVTWRNLQALREAARAVNGARKPARSRTRVATSSRKKMAAAARKKSAPRR